MRQITRVRLGIAMTLFLAAVLLATPQKLFAQNSKWYGIIYNRSAHTEGLWIIGGRHFLVTSQTIFDQGQGRLIQGMCVSVEFVGNTATRIESESIRVCPQRGGLFFNDVSGDSEWHGIVSHRPLGMEGTWTVGGLSFTATSGSWLDQDEGALTIGSCASVDFAGSIAIRIKSRAVSYCYDSDSSYAKQALCSLNSGTSWCAGCDPSWTCAVRRACPAGSWYATIKSMPPSMYGTWNIGDYSFIATERTQFSQHGGPFGIGVCASIEFSNDEAVKIDTQRPELCQPQDTSNKREREFCGADCTKPSPLITLTKP